MNDTQNKIAEKIREISLLGLTDKATDHSYDLIYPSLLEKYIDRKINILEVGIGKGGNLLILSQLFPGATIYGIDYANNLRIETKNTNIIILPPMDQSDPEMLRYLPMLDIVMEDASHNYTKSMATFNLLHPLLSPGSLYIIEDIYPEFFDLYSNDQRFIVKDARHIKGRQDDVIAYYEHTNN